MKLSQIFKALILTVVLCAPTIGIAFASESPKNIIEKTIDQVLVVNKQFSGDAQTSVRRQKLRTIIEPYFDFEEMAKRSLGAQWLKLNSTERKEFVDVFSELLARTYLARIDTVTTDIIDVKDEKVQAPKAIVKTTINHNGDTFPIDYRMLQHKGETNWVVYDVVIENIGLVANYRNEFAGIIRKEKFSGLLKRLKEKVAETEPTKEAALEETTNSARAQLSQKIVAETIMLKAMTTESPTTLAR